MMHLTQSKKTLGHSWRFDALGTSWEIASSSELTSSLRKKITQLIDSFDGTYSRFREDSLVSSVAQEAGAYTFPESAKVLFDFYDVLYDATNGQVTPFVGGTLEDLGYDKAYSLRQKQQIRQVPNYKQLLVRSGARMTFKHPALLDIGAIGKGYLVDRISDELANAGHTHYIVDGSGDMRVVGETNEMIGLEDPRETGKVIGIVSLRDQSLCASAVNKRAWNGLHHVIDPSTSRPSVGVLATWVVADSTMIADGLATALFFSEPKKLQAHYNYEYIRMHANGSIEYSDFFKEALERV